MKKINMKKVILTIIISSIILCSIGVLSILGINSYVKSSVEDKILTPDEASTLDADCILVLGAGIWSDGTPSAMLEDRLLQGIELYNLGASDRLLMSGDNGSKNYDEVSVMKNYAIDKGIDSEDIFKDHAGFSTYESMYRARDIFEAKKVIVVTQEYHLYRALYIGEKLGLDVYGVPSNPREYVGQEGRDFREVLARVKDFFYTILKPEPTFLGDSIPISGSGDY